MYFQTHFKTINYLHFNLCHFGMTPLRAVTQYVNDVPYTTPAEIGPKIGSRAYRGNVISGRGLFRLSLNASLQIAVDPLCIWKSVLRPF